MLTQNYDQAVISLASLTGENAATLKSQLDRSLGLKVRKLGAELHMNPGRSNHAKGLQLAYHAWYGTPLEIFRDTAAWCDRKTEAEARKLATDIRRITLEEAKGAGAGSCKLSGSFMYANSLAIHDVGESIQRASWLMSRAWPGLINRNVEQHKIRYRRWFGASSSANGIARFNKVKDKFKKIHDALCVKPLMLYYRGAGAVGPNDCAEGVPSISEQSFFGAAYPNGAPAPAFDPKYTHMFLGAAYFKSASLYGNDAMAGVIIHELSHAIVGTDDHDHPVNGKTCYGHPLCKDIAINYPALAIDNADNYEFFCEEYQKDGWVPPTNRPHVGKVLIPARFQPLKS